MVATTIFAATHRLRILATTFRSNKFAKEPPLPPFERPLADSLLDFHVHGRIREVLQHCWRKLIKIKLDLIVANVDVIVHTRIIFVDAKIKLWQLV